MRAAEHGQRVGARQSGALRIGGGEMSAEHEARFRLRDNEGDVRGGKPAKRGDEQPERVSPDQPDNTGGVGFGEGWGKIHGSCSRWWPSPARPAALVKETGPSL